MAGRRLIMRVCEETCWATVSRSRFVTSKPVSAGFDEELTEVTIADAVEVAEISLVLER